MTPVQEALNSRHWELIDRHGALVTDPIERYRFVQSCWKTFQTRRELRPVDVLECLWRSSARAVRKLGVWDWAVLLGWRNRRRAGVAAIVALALTQTGAPLLLQPVWGRGSHNPVEVANLPFPQEGSRQVWMVELGAGGELYSNGLRVFDEFLASTGEPLSRPAGIVYHTTESDLLPLEPVHRDRLRQRGRNLLSYVRRRGLYHFVIDRFGRVWRIVPENQAAHHAGHSIWADAGRVYLNLNQSFLGVAFEARTGTGPEAGVTAAQVYSARLLTQMLRGAWDIAEANCVSHELVSVNPLQMLIGYHTDWAGSFPYDQLGLGNQYERPLPSVAEFGFGYDDAFVAAVGGRLWPGIRLAQAGLERQAAAQGISLERCRRELKQRYQHVARETRAPSFARKGAEHAAGN